MNKVLAVTTLALVAVVMVMGTVAPAMAIDADADSKKRVKENSACKIVSKLVEEGKVPRDVLSKVCKKIVDPNPPKK